MLQESRIRYLIPLLITCSRLANLASGGPGIRYKESRMPFVQMENISHFLRACQLPPLNLQTHDVFQTVDLYEAKDPAQVLQCIVAFSRRAHAIQPSRFVSEIGGKIRSGYMSPQSTGGRSLPRPRDPSNTSDVSSTTLNLGVKGRASPTKSLNGGFSSPPSGSVSSWSKKADEGATTPAWNIHQYGYMGGASQGNQGITFGGRRQITTPAPKVPSLAEKERIRRGKAAEAERLQAIVDEAEHKRRLQQEAAEERDRAAEEQRLVEEAGWQRERQQAILKEEQRSREADTRKWQDAEQARVIAEREAESSIDNERQRTRAVSDARLNGQFLSQYQAEQRQLPSLPGVQGRERAAEPARVERPLFSSNITPTYSHLQEHDLPAHFENASPHNELLKSSRPLPRAPSRSQRLSDQSWKPDDERDFLRGEWKSHNDNSSPSPRDLNSESPSPPPQPPRPLPIPKHSPLPTNPSTPSPFHHQSRPLPPSPTKSSYTPPLKPSFPTKPSGLLAREMELDRLRQQEWEESQKKVATATVLASSDGSTAREGTRPGEGAWDVNQYGYLGGDNQNRGGPGLGGRRQIFGPRFEVRR